MCVPPSPPPPLTWSVSADGGEATAHMLLAPSAHAEVAGLMPPAPPVLRRASPSLCVSGAPRRGDGSGCFGDDAGTDAGADADTGVTTATGVARGVSCASACSSGCGGSFGDASRASLPPSPPGPLVRACASSSSAAASASANDARSLPHGLIAHACEVPPFVPLSERYQPLPADAALISVAPAFVPDPVGGVNLAAFSVDRQNVHRSSVQTTVAAALEQVMTLAPSPQQDTLRELTAALHALPASPKQRAALDAAIVQALRVLDDIRARDVTCFEVRYMDVLDRVWAVIRAHDSREQLVWRLLDEVLDSFQQCSNGCMCRLINVLQGFVISVTLPETVVDAFRTEMARLRELPAHTRSAAATSLLDRYNVPLPERAAWLDAVVDELAEDVKRAAIAPSHTEAHA